MQESIEFSQLKLNSLLLIDIMNYFKTKEIISSLYYNKYKNLLQYEKHADKYWLISDIILFTKKNNLSSYKKKSKMYNKLDNLYINDLLYISFSCDNLFIASLFL